MNSMLSHRRWTLLCIGILVLGLGLVSLTTIIIDPFFHYHGPLKNLQYPINNERYQNDGIVRHFPYDALVTGTSMTENFKTTEIDAIFQVTSVKVPFSGGPYKEINNNLKRAVEANPRLSCIIRSLDYSMLIADKDTMRTDTDYPEYLYDDIWWNDAAYVLNKEVLITNSLGVLRYTRSGQETTAFDAYARWNDSYVFGKEAVDKTYSRRAVKEEEEQAFTEEDREMIKGNLTQNVISLAKKNPQITFYLFFTPYSIYYWDSLDRDGNLTRSLDAERYAIQLLLDCDNIRLYSFNDEFDMVCDLDNYKDIAHYGAEINSQMLRWMKEGEHLLTKDNYVEYLETVRKFYTAYEYDRLFADGGKES